MSLIGLTCQQCEATLHSYEEEDIELCFDCQDADRQDAETEHKDWGVWCRVSGGVTGSREAWLKEDGQQWYGTEEDAVAKAAGLQGSMGKHSTASFRYTARRTY